MGTADLLAKPALTLGARAIPVPGHLSESAQLFLAAAGMAPSVPEPSGDTQQEWDEAAAGWNDRILPQIEPILAQIPMQTESVTVGSCQVHIATPPDLSAARNGYAFMDIHGGGLVFRRRAVCAGDGGVPRGFARMPCVLGGLPRAAGAPLSRRPG